MKKTSVFQNGLIWFGAAVSISEIITGTYFSSMDITTGILAIIIGHLIGGGLLYFAGLIGAKTGKGSMESSSISFGKWGYKIFAALNICQLIGWSSIMIYDGALALDNIFDLSFSGHVLWCAIIGTLIILWIFIGVNGLGKINIIAMAALFILTIVMTVVIFNLDTVSPEKVETLSFAAAIELSVSMPVSWLPVISDYTKDAKEPKKTSAVSAIVYSIVSCWMFVIGMLFASFTGSSDITQMFTGFRIGIIGLIVIILSTVTTTVLDVYSAGVSTKSVSSKIDLKTTAIIVSVIAAICASIFDLYNITEFLYLISSIFTPMISVLIADVFINGRKVNDNKFSVSRLVIWGAGFTLYRILLYTGCPIGSTVPVVAFTILITVFYDKIIKKQKK